MEYLWVGLGGFLGANARYGLGRLISSERLGGAFPAGTLVVNLSGCLAIGLILTLLTDQFDIDPLWRRLAVIGFLGGYTTFSSYTFEAIALAEQGAWARAVVYIVGSNAGGLLACFAGIVLARAIGR